MNGGRDDLESNAREDDGGDDSPLVGWHCTSCNRYLQREADDPPTACPICGETDSFVPITHAYRSTDRFVVGETVVCNIVGEVEEYVVGRVTEVRSDRLVVDARDGTGSYVVTPEQVVGTRGG